MPELLDQLLDVESESRASALDDYRALLARRDAPQDGDADRLRAVMNALGITPADFERDAAALTQAAGLARQILGPAGLAKLRADYDAALAKWLDDAKRLMKDAIDILPMHQHDRMMSMLVLMSGLPDGSQRETELRERGANITSRHSCAVGSNDFYVRQAADLRVKFPRAFDQ